MGIGQIWMTSTSSSRPAKSAPFRVTSGRSLARAIDAMRRSARRRRGLRPEARAAAYIRPYARAASTSKGNGSNAASARCRRSCRRARSATSLAAAGPAASSAIVTADTATCSGNTSAAILSRSMTTDVSSKPRGPRSATWVDVLIDYLVQVPAHAFPVEAGRVAEHLDGGRCGHEAVATQRAQLSHRTSIAAHHEGPALIEGTHNATAVVSQLPLTDLLAHATTVALGATVVDSQPRDDDVVNVLVREGDRADRADGQPKADCRTNITTFVATQRTGARPAHCPSRHP